MADIVRWTVAALITGDKRDLPGMVQFEGTRIVSVREFLTMNGRL